MKFLSVLLFLSNLTTVSCNQSDNCSKGEKAKFVFGLSYCNPIIQLETGDYLEVLNMDNFDIEPALDKEILVQYHSIKGGSSCQMGWIVELDCVQER